MVKSLTALDLANASLLDEGTAAAEAMILAYNQAKGKKPIFLIDSGVLPQTIAVVQQRAKGFGIQVVLQNLRDANGKPSLPPDSQVPRNAIHGVLVQYPDVNGSLADWSEFAAEAKAAGALVAAATDLLALTLIKPPGEWGADVALGNAARFGVPPGYGGPHAAFFAVADSLKRKIPGRLVGVTKDVHGKPAYRLALQTREQHIRREKATSNICTAQALLANMSAMYAVYHGPDELRRIASKTHALTRLVYSHLSNLGYQFVAPGAAFFDTLTLDLAASGDNLSASSLNDAAVQAGLNLRKISDDKIGFSLDESVTLDEVAALIGVFAGAKGQTISVESLLSTASQAGLTRESLDSLKIDGPLARESPFMQQPIFNSYKSETELLRYITRLQSKDMSLAQTMIPLGSCTMKLNGTSSMSLLSQPGWASLHPFVPADQAQGYHTLISELENDLRIVTGLPGVSLQPNSGAQGEFAGLSTIRAYQRSVGEDHRDVCLIPASAHGTNPASAAMAGLKVVAVKNLSDGSLDLDDLKAKAAKHADKLAVFMVTYPSTYGVFEEKVSEACRTIHEHGGQVYLDGANLQAQVGLTSPAKVGADVTHLNLHKTFSIPHGGGGPGVGPICSAKHLEPFLPGHPSASEVGMAAGAEAIGPISAAPYGSASILTIAWAYIRQLGWDGLRDSSAHAMLAANYMAGRLAGSYKLRYTNAQGRVAHEFLLDLAEFKSAGVQVMDVAKRLGDFGFHAPTCSWPISTGLLIEPTESESLAELDRFIDAMLAIRQEIADVVEGKITVADSPLKHAPHTISVVGGNEWDRKYTRESAAYPVPSLREHKVWPAVGRVDDAYGDLNLVCECGSVDEYSTDA